ncbi:CopD family protein [Marinobacter sp.]|uniref:CopD family protein n=1 Tax=Marinobacter sp. TaxID=50741 RepID=UPI0019DA88D5|nr:CopD family protein [Marinobacter sp.]MBE0486060.1 CopD family protein [Marinobacter sp.]
MDIWTLLTVVTKVLIYLGTAGVIGGLFCLWLLKPHGLERPIQGYMFVAGLLGLAATAVSFPVYTGAAIGDGIAGAFDPDIAVILWQTNVGDSTRARLLGFILALAGVCLLRRGSGYLRYALIIAGAVSLLFSFTQTGHLHDDNRGTVLLVIHLLGVSLWLGSLYPLRRASDGHGIAQLQASMDRFGQTAVAFVGALVICGVLMTLILVQPLSGLIYSAYGWLLLIKLSLVSLLLALGAINKFYLVPRLTRPGHSQRLRTSISAEMALGVAILVMTALLTTAVGPE